VNVQSNTWQCFAGCGGGSVIDLIAKFEGIDPREWMKKQGFRKNGVPVVDYARPSPVPSESRVIESVYSYTDALGREVFQVVRYKPKDFRQRRQDGRGSWIWNMEGVERVLYRLPQVIKASSVIVCEGEKDADNLNRIGFVATTNVGGAKKWLDGYSEALQGKDIVIIGDNDKAGKEHVDTVFDSLAGKVKSTRILDLPKEFKDVSDFIDSFGPEDPETIRECLTLLIDTSPSFLRGVKLPIFSMAEMEDDYRRQVRALNSGTDSLSLAKWIPGLRDIRSLIPGEVVLIIGDTGVGKTGVLQNIAIAANPMKTLMFEMELPKTLLFERYVASSMRVTCDEVEQSYRQGEGLGQEALMQRFPHIFVCPKTSLSLENIESLIVQSELKIGEKPKLVLIDYVQLMQGDGKRYERTSDAAEGIKTIAKSTETIIVIASQVSRASSEIEINLHSGKDSGSLENSSGLVLGIWRDERDSALLHLKVLKNTKGRSGLRVECNYDGSRMRITERSKVSDADIPLII